MTIFLHSPSHRLINEQLARLQASFVKKAGPRAQVIKFVAGAETAARDLVQQFGTASLFASKQLVIIRHAAEMRAAELEIIVERLKSQKFSAGTTIVFVEHDPLPAQTKNKLMAFLKKSSSLKKRASANSAQAAAKNNAVKLLDIKVPTGRQATSDLTTRAKDHGVTLTAAIAAQLIERLSGEYDRILYELDGLIALALSKKSSSQTRDADAAITAEDLAQSNQANLESDIFTTIGALSSRKLQGALQLLHRHLVNGAHPLYLLTMMRYQFRVLIMVQAAQAGSKSQPPARTARDISAITGLPWFVVNKAQTQLRGFGKRDLKQIFDKLVDADEAIKTSRIDGDVALDLLAVAICG